MFKQSTNIQSEHADKYLSTLCRHFARKVPAQWDEEKGKVEFPYGTANMHLIRADNHLNIICIANSLENSNKLRSVIESHVQTFSRREVITLK